jgi:hypothetical protein
MRKIYDCFTFFNELDLLELRLEEHFHYVDYFVIAEANKSHQGFDKPYYLEENWGRYEKYHNKIIHIKVDDMPTSNNTWVLENHQRNALAKGIVDADDNDVIIISDCDELLRSSTFEIIRNDDIRSLWICRQPIFWFKINYLQSAPVGYNVNSMAIIKGEMTTPQELRNLTWWAFTQVPLEFETDHIKTIQHAGWHFTYLGDENHVKHKLLNFAHAEERYRAENVNIDLMIKERRGWDNNTKFESVIFDEYFPKTITENLDLWKHLIIPDATIPIRSLLPV